MVTAGHQSGAQGPPSRGGTWSVRPTHPEPQIRKSDPSVLRETCSQASWGQSPPPTRRSSWPLPSLLEEHGEPAHACPHPPSPRGSGTRRGGLRRWRLAQPSLCSHRGLRVQGGCPCQALTVGCRPRIRLWKAGGQGSVGPSLLLQESVHPPGSSTDSCHASVTREDGRHLSTAQPRLVKCTEKGSDFGVHQTLHNILKENV